MQTTQKTHNVQFRDGSVHLVCGPSGSGKTQRIHEYLRLKNDLFEKGKEISHVIFYYAIWQPEYTEMQEEGLVQEWVNEFPTNDAFQEKVSAHPRTIVILDDAMNNIGRDLVQIVTVTARHTKATTFILFQSLFPAHPLARQISLNSKYLHLFKNPREGAQIQVLARQLQPQGYKYIVDAYHAATEQPYSCFIIDLMQETPEYLRFKSNILPHEWPMLSWVKKGTSV